MLSLRISDRFSAWWTKLRANRIPTFFSFKGLKIFVLSIYQCTINNNWWELDMYLCAGCMLCGTHKMIISCIEDSTIRIPNQDAWNYILILSSASFCLKWSWNYNWIHSYWKFYAFPVFLFFSFLLKMKNHQSDFS